MLWNGDFTVRDAIQRVLPVPCHPSEVGTWNLEEVRGRLVQISGEGVLTLATQLVADAQKTGELVAWVCVQSDFYPPDVAASGVDLNSLIVVRVQDARAAARAADRMVRSGGFGLVVVDLTEDPELPLAVQSRLLGLAQRHEAAVVCLVPSSPEDPSLSPLISLRAHGRREQVAPGVFRCVLEPLRDKRRGISWTFQRDYAGPDGVR